MKLLTIKNTIGKYLLATIVAVLLSNPTFAANENMRESCLSQQELAHAIMQARQAGVPLSDSLGIAKGNEVVEAIVRMAFVYPKFNSSEAKSDAADTFANKIFLMCMQVRSGKMA